MIVPKSHPVQPLKPGQKAERPITCGHCGLSWDDAISTSMTPAPAGRCPFEYFHTRSRSEGAQNIVTVLRAALNIVARRCDEYGISFQESPGCPHCQDRPGFNGLGKTCKTCNGTGNAPGVPPVQTEASRAFFAVRDYALKAERGDA